MKKLEVSRLESYVDSLIQEKDGDRDYFKKLCMNKLKEAGFDMSKQIDFEDTCHTITFTQEE